MSRRHFRYGLEGERPENIIEEIKQVCGMIEDQTQEMFDGQLSDTVVFQRQGNSLVVFGFNSHEVELDPEKIQQNIPRAVDLDALFTDEYKSDEPPLSWN